MASKLSVIWDTHSPLNRGPYLLVGILLFALKHNIDRFVATAYFNHDWSLFNYLILPGDGIKVQSLSGPDINFYATLLTIAIPFIYVGVILTLRRLHTINLPSWLIVFFFMPFINMLFFIILAVIPGQKEGIEFTQKGASRMRNLFNRIIPEHPLGSAMMALLLTLPTTIALTAFCVSALGNYGWSLFVGLPFTLGVVSVLVHSHHNRKSFANCLLVSTLAVTFLGLGLFAVAIEGAICLLMAAPIGLILGIMGGAIGYIIQDRRWAYAHAHRLMLILLCITPLLMGAESKSPAQAPIIPVTTTIEIDAPPSVVWKNVVTFSELPSPDSWLFQAGIAYPMYAEIKGEGVGAIRYCNFSTGPFVEPIEVWDAPHLLKFSVTSQPPAMRELTPYGDISTPHIDNYLVSKGGQFELIELPNGRTRLEGTTWYYHRIWPYTYWQVWSDAIIHRIHARVLRHIKHLSETAQNQNNAQGNIQNSAKSITNN